MAAALATVPPRLLSMYGSPHPFVDLAAEIMSLLFGFFVLMAGPFLVYYVLTTPLRRQERARLFLHVLESAMDQGRSIERAIVSLARAEGSCWLDRMGVVGTVLFAVPWAFCRAITFRLQRRSFGGALQRLARRIEAGVPFHEAIEDVPGLAPPQVVETLRAGSTIERFDRVLPACHTILSSATSRMRSALNYVAVIGTGFVFVSGLMLAAILVFIVPRMRDMYMDMQLSEPLVFRWMFVGSGGQLVAELAWGFGCLLVGLAFLYAVGPHVLRVLPTLRGPVDRVALWLPWRRRRLQRDFSTMLTILLDADVPEALAIEMAGQSTANGVLARRAAVIAEGIEAGQPLQDTLNRFGNGEFRWHLVNALHQKTAFFDALRGWHDYLEAKAFQQEQIGAQVVTTAFMLFTGVVVALFAIGLFAPLVRLAEGVMIW